ncbi:MAG: preprotein translocase subunit SecE [Rhodothermales bacterium]
MQKIVDYVREVFKEMRKVSWPSQRELVNNTLITIVSALAVSLFIFGADWLISHALEFLYR